MSDREVWRDIEDFDTYQISSSGRIRQVDVYGNPKRGSSPKPYEDPATGRLVINLRHYSKEGNPKIFTFQLNRLVAEAFLDVPDDGQYTVKHLDWDCNNCRIDNLEVKRF